MGRARGFDEERVLAAAMRLFWQKGYSATSISDLEEATGLKRTSIYHAFGNKRAIFQKTLSLYRHQVEEMLGAIMAEAATCRAALERWFAAVLDLHFSDETPGGCLMILSVLESSQHDQQTKEMAAALFHREQELVAARLAQGVAAAELPAGFDCQSAAMAITAATSGLMVLAMADYPRAALEEIATASVSLLKRD